MNGSEENFEISKRNNRLYVVLPRERFAIDWLYEC